MRREDYINLDAPKRQARRWIAEALGEARPRGPAFAPASAALLVLDMQQYFLEAESKAFVPASAKLLAPVTALARRFREAGRPVYFTRHGDVDPESMMLRWWRGRIEPGSAEHELHPALEARPQEIIDKSQYDAFHGSELAERLEQAGAEQLVLCGVMTHLCIESTARAAFVRAYPVSLAVDATASYNEALHTASLLTLGHGVARLTTSEELLHAFD